MLSVGFERRHACLMASCSAASQQVGFALRDEDGVTTSEVIASFRGKFTLATPVGTLESLP